MCGGHNASDLLRNMQIFCHIDVPTKQAKQPNHICIYRRAPVEMYLFLHPNLGELKAAKELK